jgi:pyrroloquinoline quinone biosynthesis protein B
MELVCRQEASIGSICAVPLLNSRALSRGGAPQPGDNIGFVIRDRRSQRKILYAPGLAEIDDRVSREMSDVDCLLVDGTFWTDDEMIRLGVGRKHAREIGHLPQSGAGGMIECLRFPNTRRVRSISTTPPDSDEDSIDV